NPPTYAGPVLAPPGSGQIGSIANVYDMYGGGMTPWQGGALGTLSNAELGNLFSAPGAIGAPSVPGAIGAPGGYPSVGAPGVPGAIGMPGVSGPVGAPSLPGLISGPNLPSMLPGPSLPTLPNAPNLIGLTPTPSLLGELAAPGLPSAIGAPSYQVDAPTIQMPSDPQEAVRSLARPLMRQFTEEALPGITARSLCAGQGPTSTREDVANTKAINTLGQSITDAAIAPIYKSAVDAAIAQAQLGEAASAATAYTGANIYGSQASQNVGLTNAI